MWPLGSIRKMLGLSPSNMEEVRASDYPKLEVGTLHCYPSLPSIAIPLPSIAIPLSPPLLSLSPLHCYPSLPSIAIPLHPPLLSLSTLHRYPSPPPLLFLSTLHHYPSPPSIFPPCPFNPQLPPSPDLLSNTAVL